jgi:N-acetylmuramoyl-L-alanine amidase
MKMRIIDKLIIHCTASDGPRDNAFANVVAFHKCPINKGFWWNGKWEKGRGFKDIGYHKYIDRFGGLWNGRAIETIGAHCKDENAHSIGICLAGNKVFDPKQFETLKNVVTLLCATFNLHPLTDVYPHNHFNKDKTCPNFDVEAWLKKEFGNGNGANTTPTITPPNSGPDNGHSS